MTVVTRRFADAFTVDDLDGFPDDGYRYELIEGSLHVSPGPALPHQGALFNLAKALDEASPPDLRVWIAPLDVVFTFDTVLEPDVLVLPAEVREGERVEEVVPLLTAEVLSPSTRSYDLVHKRHVYREHGVGTYLVVDTQKPSITAFVGDDERHAEDDEALELDEPFPVRLVPAELIA
jgi:Uma2 family endonuclease